MSYYNGFKIIIGSPLWRIYLRWRYNQSINDFKKLNFLPNFKKRDFSCLLCGVGNEVTADEYIRFVLQKNVKPKIWIIDLGEEQVVAVKEMVQKKYSNINIIVKQIDALNLNEIIKQNSIDWIETDGLFEFFDNSSIQRLLKVWKSLLKSDGFITTTATSSRCKIQEFFDTFKIWIGKVWLKVVVYRHTRSQMHNNFKSIGLKYVEGPTPVPYFKRYSAVI